MKNRYITRLPLATLLLVLTVAIAVLPAFAVSVPRHENYIADDAKILSEGTVRNTPRTMKLSGTQTEPPSASAL